MKWENPPKQNHRGGGKTAWLKEATELRQNPGKWGIIAQWPTKEPRGAYSLAHNINAGKLKAFIPAGAFEAVTRQDGPVTKIHARYVGGTKAESE